MEDFKSEASEIGINLQFSKETGEIISSNKHSETHVSSSGGGGFVGRHGGHISAPQVRSTTSEKHEIWIKKEDGSEQSFSLTNEGISVREGQKVSFVYVQEDGAETAWRCLFVNHTGKEFKVLDNAPTLTKLMKLKGFGFLLTLKYWGSFIAGMILFGIILAMTSSGIVSAIVGIAAFIYLGKRASKPYDLYHKGLSEHLENIGKKLVAA